MKITRFWRVLLVLMLAGAGRSSAEESWQIYVSPDGDDRASGSMESPLRSPAAALKKSRALRRTKMRKTIIRLGEGRYDLSGGLSLSRAEGGTREAPVIFSAEAGKSVIFSGGARLRGGGWKRETDPRVLGRIVSVPARDRVLRFDLKAQGLRDYGQHTRRGFDAVSSRQLPPPAMLCVDGERMTLARWPNQGTVRMAEVIDKGPVWHSGAPDAWDQCLARGGTFRVDFDRLRHWTKADDLWLDGVFSYDWCWSYNKVAMIDAKARTLTLRYGEADGLVKDDWLFDAFFAENLLEELDAPGEYFIDRSRGVLYFHPPDGFRPGASETVLSMAEAPLLSLRGASWLWFQGIGFEGGRSHAVEIEGGRQLVFKGCAFRNCGGFGMVADANGLRVENCLFRQLGGRGICLKGGDARALSPSGNVVENCDFSRTSQVDKAFHGAIRLEGVGHTVRHCRFHDLPHMAIYVFGNDFLIENNEFTGTATLLRDMGAIYVNSGHEPHMRGTVIRNNYFHDIGVGGNGKRMAVYPDNGASGVTVAGNLFHRIGSRDDDWAVMNHGGAYVRVEDNIFLDCSHPYHLGFWWATYGKDGFEDAMRQWRKLLKPGNPATAAHLIKYPELRRFFQENRACPDTNTFSRNLIINLATPLAAQDKRGFDVFGGPEDALQREGNRILNQNPGFLDLPNGDLGLAPESPVLRELPGLRKIDFSKMGPQTGKAPVPRALPVPR